MVAGFQKPLREAGQLLLLRLPAQAAVSPAWCLCCIEQCWPSSLCLLPEKGTGKWYSRGILVLTSVYYVVLVSKWLFCVQTQTELSLRPWTACVEVFFLRLLQKGLERMDTRFFFFYLMLIHQGICCKWSLSVGILETPDKNIGQFDFLGVLDCTVHF